ncbi:MAG: peptidyl-prolyl cis-trans isomerase [Actinomycetota bacterium]|nr:peptidyl-prolyl cis-trans isomerase [Actinomycetota bacterium]
MRPLKYILALGAFFVVAVGISACGSGVPGDSVADVAGNPITARAFNHWMYVAAKGNAAQSPGAPVIVPTDPPSFKGCVTQVRKEIPTLAKTPDKTIVSDCKQLFTSLSSQVMDFLIKAYWYQGDASKLHIKVTDQQVQTAFAAAKKQQFPTATAFNSFLSQTGQTMQDIIFRVRINQIFKQLLAKHSVTVTPAQIASYYAAHQTQFGTKESRDIRIVRTNSAATAKVAKTALAHRQSWTAVAKKYSVDAATKGHGGLLSGVTQGQEEHALDQAAFAAPVNKVLGPVHGTFGYYVFEVIKVKAATHQSLAQATPAIKQLLSSQSQTTAQNAVDKVAKSHWLAKTTCRAGYAMADCKGFKAPKTSTTTAPSGTPPAATATAPATTTPTSTTPPTPTTSSTPTTTTTP